MKKVVNKDGKQVLLSTAKDVEMYDGHENQGPNSNRWTALMAHRLKSAGVLEEDQEPRPEDYVFYLAHYTCWQGEHDCIEEISQEEAAEFAAEHFADLVCHLGLLDESKFE